MITLAKPSIALSSPKPISAIDDATMPAAIATPPSTVIHARLNHDSVRARFASRRYVASSMRGTASAAGSGEPSPAVRMLQLEGSHAWLSLPA